MGTKLDSTVLQLYIADEKTNVIRRQNNRVTASFTIDIKDVGTTLLLVQSDYFLTDEDLANKIKAGNSINKSGDDGFDFDMTYYQLLAYCSLSDTIQNKGYTGTLTVNYRMSVTAPSGKTTDQRELFVANTLLARAARQASRTTESIQTEIIEPEAEPVSPFVYLILVAAKADGEDNKPYTFREDDNENTTVSDEEAAESNTIVEFLNSDGDTSKSVSAVRVLGYFPKDQPDFERFVAEEYKVQVIGNCTFAIAENTSN